MSEPKPHHVYHHYKGGVYLVTDLDIDTDTKLLRVSYQHLHTGSTHSRRIEDWNMPVAGDDAIERFQDITRHLPELIQAGLDQTKVLSLRNRQNRISELRKASISSKSK